MSTLFSSSGSPYRDHRLGLANQSDFPSRILARFSSFKTGSPYRDHRLGLANQPDTPSRNTANNHQGIKQDALFWFAAGIRRLHRSELHISCSHGEQLFTRDPPIHHPGTRQVAVRVTASSQHTAVPARPIFWLEVDLNFLRNGGFRGNFQLEYT